MYKSMELLHARIVELEIEVSSLEKRITALESASKTDVFDIFKYPPVTSPYQNPLKENPLFPPWIVTCKANEKETT